MLFSSYLRQRRPPLYTHQQARYLRPGAAPWPTAKMDRRTRWPGCRDGGGLSLGAKLRHSLSSGKKPAAAARTLRTNGTIANGAELQKFDRNQKSDVFLIETAEANVRTLLTRWGTPSSHRHVWIAQIAPLHERVPPRLHGGTERVVSFLTEELVRQGHDVTLSQAATPKRRLILFAAAIWPCA